MKKLVMPSVWWQETVNSKNIFYDGFQTVGLTDNPWVREGKGGGGCHVLNKVCFMCHSSTRSQKFASELRNRRETVEFIDAKYLEPVTTYMLI